MVGRPTKYDPKYIDMVDEYLEQAQDHERQVVRIKKGDKETYDYKMTVKLPTIGGFALFADVPERTLYDWADRHEAFSQSLAKIVQEQRERLINNGLSGDYNSTIAKLILSSNHDMAEKSDVNQRNTDTSFEDDDPDVKSLKQEMAKEYEKKRRELLKKKNN